MDAERTGDAIVGSSPFTPAITVTDHHHQSNGVRPPNPPASPLAVSPSTSASSSSSPPPSVQSPSPSPRAPAAAPASPKAVGIQRRRRKSKHIAFTVSTDSEEEFGTGLDTPADSRRRSSASILNTNGNGNGNGGGELHGKRSRESESDGGFKEGRGRQRDEEEGEGRGEGDKEEKENARKGSWAKRALDKVLANKHFAWIKPKLNFTDMKPVIRTSLSMWIGFLFMLIHPVGMQMGMAAFLVLIMSIMVPPTAPFVQFVEIMCNLFFYLSLAWVWCVIGIAIADATRVPTDPGVIAAAMARYANESPMMQQMKVIFDATYLQAKPAIISCVWLSAGTAGFLWWKMRTAPSPATFPLVLSCILIDVTFTVIPLYPTAYYKAPWLVYKPICFQAAIALLCSIVVFPQSVSGQFRRRFAGVLSPLAQAMGEIESLFTDASTSTTPTPKDGERHVQIDDDSELDTKIKTWGDRSAEIRGILLKSAVGMAPLNAQQRYLDVDITYGRLPGRDLKELFNVLASVQVRAGGFSFFFNTITNKVRRTHLDSQGFNAHRSLSMAEMSMSMSRQQSRVNSRPASRMGSAISLKDMRSSYDQTDGLRTRNSDMFDSGETPQGSSLPGTPRADRDGDISTDPGTPDVSDDEAHDSDRERGRKSKHSESLAHRLLHGFPSSLPRSRESSPHRRGSRDHSRDRTHKKRRKRDKEAKERDTQKGSTLSLMDSLRKAQQPVGVYESQRYMDLESGSERDLGKVIDQLELLSAGALPIVKALREALAEMVLWTQTSDRKRHAQAHAIATVTGHLRVALAEFQETRSVVTKPYRHLFDPSHKRDRSMSRAQHVGLFQCLVASYHLIEFSDAVLKLLDMIIVKDTTRQIRRLWLPNPLRLFRQFRASMQRENSDGPDDSAEGVEFDHAEEQDDSDLLGQANTRNPDHQPFKSRWMNLIARFNSIPDLLFSRSAMFALKAGVLGCLTSLPAFMASSARFYYYNRGMWVTIMAQMTLAVFAGDTFASWFARLLASFWGGVSGMVVWYIGSGRGNGNPYGLAAATAVFFPPMMLYRVHWPGPPITSVVYCTSVNLVIGYSYLNGHLFQLTNATWGFEVAWLRFVCVVIGITAAWIFSMVPPSYSAKRAIRYSYARSIANVGHILCQELSAANDPHNRADMAFNQHVRGELLVQRAKLTKLGVRHANAKKELSLRGQWPKDAYAGLQGTLVETMSLLAMFNHLLPQMAPNWRKALLLRTRMCDPLFLGDVFAVISMTSSALRAATPLPQITPGPLIAKYHMNKYKGVDLPRDPAEIHEDVPTHVTAEVLQSDDYMRYALGVSTIYALMSRLDSIVVVCKTLLGENFHIDYLRLTETIKLIA